MTAAFLAASLWLAGCSPANEPSQQAPASTAQTAERTAAVAIPDKYGAQVAEEVLRAGGNAVDAAVAVGFSMAVTFVDAGNIGGGGFMMIYMDGAPAFLDYREAAALAAHRDMYLDEHGEVIENASLIGAQAAGVPGTVAGLWEAHQRYGRDAGRQAGGARVSACQSAGRRRPLEEGMVRRRDQLLRQFRQYHH
jgi:gamma-glutamyltranspeptidase/glutathione hydrolase